MSCNINNFFCRGVMSIINITPDSFYTGSRRESDHDIEVSISSAIDHGAAYIDLGGYSSRPGAEDISPDEELARLRRAMNIIIHGEYNIYRMDQVAHEQNEVRITIDTFRSSVVEALYQEYGPCFGVNDISAGELDDNMLNVVARCGLPYIAMHMRGTPQNMINCNVYDDMVGEIMEYLDAKLAACRRLGIQEIALDPGFGFAKNIDQNFQLMSSLAQFDRLEAPLLVGVSRKSMIYKTLGVGPQDALVGTIALNWQSLLSGASILRVHDTAPAVELFKLYDRYIRAIHS